MNIDHSTKLNPDYGKIAALLWRHAKNHSTPGFVMLVAVFPLLFLYKVISSYIGWHRTMRSGLDEEIVLPDAYVPGIHQVRRMAAARVELGLRGYQAWVEFCDLILLQREIEGNRTGQPAG